MNGPNARNHFLARRMGTNLQAAPRWPDTEEQLEPHPSRTTRTDHGRSDPAMEESDLTEDRHAGGSAPHSSAARDEGHGTRNMLLTPSPASMPEETTESETASSSSMLQPQREAPEEEEVVCVHGREVAGPAAPPEVIILDEDEAHGNDDDLEVLGSHHPLPLRMWETAEGRPTAAFWTLLQNNIGYSLPSPPHWTAHRPPAEAPPPPPQVLHPDDPTVLVETLMARLHCPICYRGFRRKRCMVQFAQQLVAKRCRRGEDEDTSPPLSPVETSLSDPSGEEPVETDHETSEVRVARCGHVYCEQCITKYVAKRKQCPVCNQSLTARQLYPLYL